MPQPVSSCTNTHFPMGSGSFLCMLVYIWLLFTNVCKVVCSPFVLLCIVHTQKQRVSESPFGAKKIKIEGEIKKKIRNANKNTATQDWVTSVKLWKILWCCHSLLLDRNTCVSLPLWATTVKAVWACVIPNPTHLLSVCRNRDGVSRFSLLGS